MVVNLDPEGMEGTHWIALYAFGMNREVYYFDSLALPISPIIMDVFLKNFPKVISNPKPLQPHKSNNCGHHCIIFLYFISQNYTFDQYLQFLNSQPNVDHFVKVYLNKLVE